MREGIYWRGSNRARRRQQERSPNQSFVLPSGVQARGRLAVGLVVCLILCFVTWTLSRFRTPSPISTESVRHQAPARAVVFDLYWYPRARNETFSALAGPAHRRRRGLLKTTESTRQEIFDEEEQEEQAFDGEGFGDNPSLEHNLLKKRTGCNNDCHSMVTSHGASSSSTRAAWKPWRLRGGHRRHDRAVESLYAEIALGNPRKGKLRQYVLQVDTGGGPTWVNCVGSSLVGPAGHYKPRKDSYLNCETRQEMCANFQALSNPEPCDRGYDFRCLYSYSYGDGSLTGGSVINADIGFDLTDGSEARHTVAIGCSTEVTDSVFKDFNVPDVPSFIDGILGLGRHPTGLLSQLRSLNLFSEYVTALCLDHARPSRAVRPLGGSHEMKYTGFLSFGDLYTSQAASTVWTASIIPRDARRLDADVTYTANLVRVTYRDSIITFGSKKRKRDDDIGYDSALKGGMQLGFDTGSDLTYLRPKLLKLIKEILDEDAKRMGYENCHDSADLARRGMFRTCWSDPQDSRKPILQNFGELILNFASLANDDTTSDLVIKPEYYITASEQAYGSALRTCFNLHSENIFPSGNLGSEVMRGHLFLFKERPHQIGWSPVTSCKKLR